jgi:hypothetical protein
VFKTTCSIDNTGRTAGPTTEVGRDLRGGGAPTRRRGRELDKSSNTLAHSMRSGLPSGSISGVPRDDSI